MAAAKTMGLVLLLSMVARGGPGGTTAVARVQALPSSVDLRPELDGHGLAPRAQGARGTCSALVVAGALEAAAARREGRGTRLSPEFLIWAANRVRPRERDGGFFSELWAGFAAHGICAETNMPYRPVFEPAKGPDAAALADAKARLAHGLRPHWIKEWNVNTGLTNGQIEEIKRALAKGWPVCGGLRWPKAERWVEDVLQMCPPEAVFDGHSILLVGYRDDPARPGGGVFLFRNTARGGRDGCMPYAYAHAYMNDALWIE